MRVKVITLVAATALVGVLVVPALVPAAAVQLEAQLKGKNEVPKADPDGTGRAEVKLRRQKRKVCFLIEYENIAEPFAGHIHEGEKGENGDVVVTLFSSETGSFPTPVGGCVRRVKKSLISAIAANPNHYYVNIHNEDYPDGAIRGQLKLRPGT